MGVYICSKCGSVVESASYPISSGCPAGSVHQWHEVSRNGSIAPKPGYSPYECTKCGKIIYSKSYPLGAHCPSGGSHHWIKLNL